MKKFYAVLFIILIVSCSFFNSSKEVWVQNDQNENLYVKIDGLQNAPHHKLVFIQHGLASNLDHGAIQTAKRAFLNNNYVVVTFDSRYSLGNSGNDVAKVRFSTFEEDLQTITDWAKTQSFYSEPFALVGHSLGGAAVLQYGAENPQKVNILVPIAPVVSGRLWEESCMENMPEFCQGWQQHGSYQYTDPKSRKTAIIPYNVVISSMAYDAHALAPQIKAQTLLIAAEKDIVIAPSEAEKLSKAFSGNIQSVVVSNSGHNFESRQNLKDLYRDIDTFLKSIH